MKHRLQPIDWMRGIVMMIMVTDHASAAFNADRAVSDSALFPGWQEPLDGAQFLFRWVSHLCAPVFVFLAGTSLALSVDKKIARGATAWQIDRDLLLRGLLLLVVELFFINMFWGHGRILLQVLFAIGASMIAMVVLRRLPSVWLLAFALISLTVGEWTRTGDFGTSGSLVDSLRALLIDGGNIPIAVGGKDGVMAAYPMLPWCGIMAAGWVLGRYFLRKGDAADGEVNTAQVVRPLALTGVGLLALFAVFRGLNDFGNLGLLRMDSSVLQWLHVSKYPPSLTFATLELGIMFLILAGLFRIDAVRGRVSGSGHPVLVFGQTAFFFYVAHIAMLEAGAAVSGYHKAGNLWHTMIAAVAVHLALYPMCLAFRELKSRYPRSVLRFF